MLVRTPLIDTLRVAPSEQDLRDYVCAKYGTPMAPSPLLRYRLGYVSADDTYEALVSKLVREATKWLDVGCGRDIFPSNYQGARRLAERAALVVGVDPDENVQENDLLSERFRGTIEAYKTDEKFNLVTMRMVAEHVQEPEACVEKLSELTETNGLAVIYTPSKWAPVSVAATVVPFALHNRFKRIIWNTEERDTFPTAYKMNTRRTLQRLFANAGFEEVYFSRIDDCSILTKWLTLNKFEIRLRNLSFHMRLRYPEACLLAVFRRQ